MVRHHKQQRVRLQCWFDADAISISHRQRKGNGSRARLRAFTRSVNPSPRIYIAKLCPNKICPRSDKDNRLEVRLRRLSEGKCIDSETIIPFTKELGSDFSSRRRLNTEKLHPRRFRGVSRRAEDLLATKLLDYIGYNISLTSPGKSRCYASRLQKPFANTHPLSSTFCITSAHATYTSNVRNTFDSTSIN